jgi:archaellum component FlaC
MNYSDLTIQELMTLKEKKERELDLITAELRKKVQNG